MPRTLRLTASFVVLVVGATASLYLIHAPSPFLLGGLIGGAAFSLVGRSPWTFPDPARHLGIAVIGVGAGALIDSGVIRRIAGAPVEILGGVLITVVFSLLTGLLLLLSPHVNPPTAMLSSLAGAASGVSAVARDMGADDAIVSAIQYARVVLVVVSVAFVAPLLGGAEPAAPPGLTPDTAQPAVLRDVLLTALCVGGGLLVARVARFSGSSLVIPLVLAVSVAVSVPEPFSVPEPLLNLGYSIAGLAVGFSFTPATIKLLIRLFPLTFLQLLASIGGSALIGLGFARAVGIPDLAGYLAMAPGGLPIVTAIAVESGAEVGLVVTMQLVRVFAAMLAASIIGNSFTRR
jgi:membrane AbrB-like protein